MSTGYAIQSQVPWPDSSLPVFRDDLGLTAGSLFMFSPSHSAIPLVGVPSNGAAIPNIAWRECAKILGSGNQTSLAGSFESNFLSTDGFLERTPKGALHGGWSQVNDTSLAHAVVRIPAVILAYIYNNTAVFAGPDQHSFYYSLWTRITRMSLAPTLNAFMGHTALSTSAFKLMQMLGSSDQPGVAPAGNGSTQDPGFQPIGRLFRSQAVSRWFGNSTKPATAADQVFAVGWGGFDSYGSSSTRHKNASHAIEQMHIIDLTVAGLSYAQAESADHALWVAAGALGGKFYGDTLPTDIVTTPSLFP